MDIENILVVCSGNICRSPMAEGILFKKLKEKNLRHINVFSAGTFNIVGSKASEEAVQVCSDIDVDISFHLSQALTIDKVSKADLILVMEKRHLSYINTKFPQFIEKARLLGAFSNNIETKDIDDPIGKSLDFYRSIRDEISICIDNCITHLINISADDFSLLTESFKLS